ncbi:MAG: MBL fold metallo-hydrolase [Patescibacteria group bacterium]
MLSITKIPTGFLDENCWILKNAKNEVVVIDPGNAAGKILKKLAGAKVKWILLTHTHYDHLQALSEVAEKTGGKIAVHKEEAGIVEAGEFNPPSFGRKLLPSKVAQQLRDGTEIELGDLKIKVLHTPGHTPGSCCFLLGRDLFSGDTLFHRNCGRTDLPGGDAEAMQMSLKKLQELPGRTIVHPGHGPDWNIREAQKFNFSV